MLERTQRGAGPGPKNRATMTAPVTQRRPDGPAPPPGPAAFDPCFTAWVWGDVLAVNAGDEAQWQQRRARRLMWLLEGAARGSPWWQRRLREALAVGAGPLPPHGAETAGALQAVLHALPTLSKAQLMAHFDEAVVQPPSLAGPDATAARVRLADARDFVHAAGGSGAAWLGRYAVWQSSGSGGTPALFVHDTTSLAVSDVLQAARGPATQVRTMPPRVAFVGAVDGAFASVASLQRLRGLNPWLAAGTRPFSFLQPIEALAAELEAWRPTVIATYPSMAWVLAQQRARGGLRLALDAVWTGGETLGAGWRRAIGEAFGCPVRDTYGASECLEIASECDAGALHLHADWVILEPVDAQGRPVPEGETGQTTLLTNLANHVLPIVRYDLGDRVRFVPGRCACGSALPVIEVQGRCDDVLTLAGRGGHDVHLAPLALTTVLEDEAGVFDFRLEQRDRHSLVLRLFGEGREPREGGEGGMGGEGGVGLADRAGRRAAAVLRHFLRGQGVDAPRVRVQREAGAAPRGRSGKLARVSSREITPGR